MNEASAASSSLPRRAWHAAWHRRSVAWALLTIAAVLMGVVGWLAVFQNERGSQGNVYGGTLATTYGDPPVWIGTWRVDYPPTLREVDEGTLQIEYSGETDVWKTLSVLPTHLTITLRSSSGLEIRPKDGVTKDFAESVASSPWFISNYDWTIVPLQKGKHQLILSVFTAPSQFTTRSISVGKDHTIQYGPNEYALTINVVTQYYIDQAWINLGKRVIGGLAFLLALPWMKLVIERLLPRRVALRAQHPLSPAHEEPRPDLPKRPTRDTHKSSRPCGNSKS
jgi:hypothetical protein